jgi:hypothetical protein
MSTNSDRNGGNTPSDGGDITSAKSEISPPKEARNDAHFNKSGDIGDIFRLYLVKSCRKQVSAKLQSQSMNYF